MCGIAGSGLPSTASRYVKIWWAAKTEIAVAWGQEYIRVEEVVQTATVDRLVLYRHWLIDPDGCEVFDQFAPKQKELIYKPLKHFLVSLRSLKMDAADAEERDTAKASLGVVLPFARRKLKLTPRIGGDAA